MSECPDCDGTGEKINGVDGLCWKCQGTGNIEETSAPPQTNSSELEDQILELLGDHGAEVIKAAGSIQSGDILEGAELIKQAHEKASAAISRLHEADREAAIVAALKQYEKYRIPGLTEHIERLSHPTAKKGKENV